MQTQSFQKKSPTHDSRSGPSNIYIYIYLLFTFSVCLSFFFLLFFLHQKYLTCFKLSIVRASIVRTATEGEHKVTMYYAKIKSSTRLPFLKTRFPIMQQWPIPLRRTEKAERVHPAAPDSSVKRRLDNDVRRARVPPPRLPGRCWFPWQPNSEEIAMTQ